MVDLVLATYAITDARKQVVGFAGPHYVAGQQLMSRANDTSITGLESLKGSGKKVCAVRGSKHASTISENVGSGVELVLRDSHGQCVTDLENSAVDAVTSDNVILLGYLATRVGKFRLAGSRFTTEPYGIGVKRGDTAFRSWINDALEEIARGGSYRRAWQETIGKFDTDPFSIPSVIRY